MPETLWIGAPDPDGFGPWVGVPEERWRICAVDGCEAEGRPQVCHADGRYHHHGCVHYDRDHPPQGVTFRKGWGYLCDEHYAVVKADRAERGIKVY